MKKLFALIAALALFVSYGAGCKDAGPSEDEVNPIGTKAVAKKVAPAPKKPAPKEPVDVTAETGEPEPEAKPLVEAPVPNLPKTPELPIDEAKLDVGVQHMGTAIDLLEQNADDPAKAAAALDEYLKKNKQAILDWRTELEGLKEKLTPEQQQQLGVKLLGRMGPVLQKLQALNVNHPELFSDPKVKEVWGQLQ